MEKTTATTIFASLSSGLRLDVYRLLLHKGREGMVAGAITKVEWQWGQAIVLDGGYIVPLVVPEHKGPGVDADKDGVIDRPPAPTKPKRVGCGTPQLRTLRSRNPDVAHTRRSATRPTDIRL